MSFFRSGRQPNIQQVPTKTEDQMSIFQNMMRGSQPGMKGGLDFLSQLAQGDPSMFAELEAPAMRQFEGLQGDIASRFSGAGMGGRRSSGFQGEMSGSASDLMQNLRGQRMNLQQNAIKDLLGIGQNLLGQNLQENVMIPRSNSGLQELLGGLGGIGSNALIGGLTGPSGETASILTKLLSILGKRRGQ